MARGTHRSRFRIIAIIAVSLAILILAAVVLLRTAPRLVPQWRSFLALPERQRKPQWFEPYLVLLPNDVAHREAALVWYNRREPDDDKLKAHTLEMARRHPGNMHLLYENVSLFYFDPEYRQQVTDVLEAHIEQRPDDREFFCVLAKICEHNAIPPKFDHRADRERWLQYFGLPPDYELPRQTDYERAEKAVGYYRQAITAADGQEFYPAFYSRQLGELLMRLERYDEAVVAYETALPDVDETSRAGFYLSYGRCLRRTDRIDEARAPLREVLAAQGDGFGGGQGCRAARAHILLGSIALSHDKDIEAAKRHLLDATTVETCCHTITQGIPLTLARDLLEEGESEAVAEFCEAVLEKFIPSHKPTQELLSRARDEANET